MDSICCKPYCRAIYTDSNITDSNTIHSAYIYTNTDIDPDESAKFGSTNYRQAES